MDDEPDLFGNVGWPDVDDAIAQAVTSMFDALEEKKLLGPVEQTKRAILTKTAKALDAGLSTTKVSVATATLVTKVMESLDELPRAVAEADSMDAWDAAVIDATRAAMDAEGDDEMVDTSQAQQ